MTRRHAAIHLVPTSRRSPGGTESYFLNGPRRSTLAEDRGPSCRLTVAIPAKP